MMPKQLLAVAMLVLLGACQQAPVKDEASPLSRIPAGSTITLQQPLVVPVGHSRVFLQFGKVVAKLSLDQYRPHCNFEVREVSGGEGVIEPDTFTVTAVMEDEEEVVMRPPSSHQAMRHVDFSFDGGESISLITRYVRYTLHSERQPGVMRLTCHGGFAEPWQVETPGIAEIRQALGGYATITLPSAI